MDKKESKFWKLLKANLDIKFLKRIENSVEPGWPDVFYKDGNSGFIELKAEQRLPSSIDFQPSQPNWLSQYSEAGGDCFVFLYVIEENTIYVWYGSQARELNKVDGARRVKPLFRAFADEECFKEISIILKCGW